MIEVCCDLTKSRPQKGPIRPLLYRFYFTRALFQLSPHRCHDPYQLPTDWSGFALWDGQVGHVENVLIDSPRAYFQCNHEVTSPYIHDPMSGMRTISTKSTPFTLP